MNIHSIYDHQVNIIMIKIIIILYDDQHIRTIITTLIQKARDNAAKIVPAAAHIESPR